MIEATAGGVRLTVHVVPGSAASMIVGVHGDAIKLRLAAQPIEGRANEALLAFVADCLDVPRRNVTLLRGQASRRKVVEVLGVGLDDARRALRVPD